LLVGLGEGGGVKQPTSTNPSRIYWGLESGSHRPKGRRKRFEVSQLRQIKIKQLGVNHVKTGGELHRLGQAERKRKKRILVGERGKEEKSGYGAKELEPKENAKVDPEDNIK